MRPTLRFALIAQALLARPAFAGEPIKPTVAFQDMLVVVTYVSIGELVNLQSKYGACIDRREIRQELPPWLLDPEDEPRDRCKDVRNLPARLTKASRRRRRRDADASATSCCIACSATITAEGCLCGTERRQRESRSRLAGLTLGEAL